MADEASTVVRNFQFLNQGRIREMRAVPFGSVLLALTLTYGLAGADDAKKEKRLEKAALAKEVLRKAKVDLLTAIETAQRRVPDGKMLAVRVEMQEDGPRYGTYFLDGDQVKEVELDAVTGAMRKVKDKRGRDIANQKLLAEARKAVNGAKVLFPQAIEIGMERVKEGKPFEAEMRFDAGKAIVEVELLAGEQIMKVKIDAADPNRIKVEEYKMK
jgi:uncharacterized membrane protein YkoI